MTEQALPHLQFINPVGFDDFSEGPPSFIAEDGFYTTVRKGKKWKNRLNQDDLFEVWGCSESHYGLCSSDKGCEYIGIGQVEWVWCGHLKHIPAYILQFEHNERCREWEGIRSRLKEIYGRDVDLDTVVTAILFNDSKNY